MCGIFCSISRSGSRSSINENHRDVLNRRGPDHHGSCEVVVDDHVIHFESWVLHMRGDVIGQQPAVLNNNVLAWNGEIFGGLEVKSNECDTQLLSSKLDECSSKQEVTEVISSTEGPWAFVYYQSSTKTLFFGRDYFGRRSLLCTFIEGCFMLSSTAPAPKPCNSAREIAWNEVPGCGIHALNLEQVSDNILANLTLYPWVSISDNTVKSADFYANGTNISYTIENCIYSPMKKKLNDLTIEYKPPFIIDHIETKSPLVTLKSYCDLTNLWPICDKLISKLQTAVKKRTMTLDSWKTKCVGVLFSGGIDCTVLALLAHRILPETDQIDLLNVAFQRHKPQAFKPKMKHNKHNIPDIVDEYLVPDRISGLATLAELQKLFPERKWNFVEINIKIEELKSMREERIASLTYPKSTVLDDSIACALWFASRGKGYIRGNNEPYTSPCHILLCGMGADEQLGGYSRHRNIFNNAEMNWAGVKAELNMEVERISSRNLGRDDRIIADHSREALFPYLDEDVVSFLMSLPVHYKTDLRLDRGIGEKILLRGSAYQIGLRGAAVLPKRAIQFGSRIAKAESGKEKGNDLCERLNFGTKIN